MHDQNNVFYAIALSLFVLITWQYFFATSFLGKPAAPKGFAYRRGCIRRRDYPAANRKPSELRPRQHRTRNDPSRSRDRRRLPDRSASPSIRPGSEDRSR